MKHLSRIWLITTVFVAAMAVSCHSGKQVSFEKLKSLGEFLGNWVPEPTSGSGESSGSGRMAEGDRITLAEIAPGMGHDRYHRQRGLFDHILDIELKSKDGLKLRGRNVRVAWKHARTAEDYQLLIWPADSFSVDTLRQWRFFTMDNDLAIDDRLEWGGRYFCQIVGYNGVVEVAKSDTFRFALEKDSLKQMERGLHLNIGKKQDQPEDTQKQ